MASIVYQEPNDSLQFQVVNNDLINEMLGEDAIVQVKQNGKLVIQEKLMVELLIALGYEDKNVQHKAWFNDQLVVDEINREFSLLVMNMTSGRIIIHQRTDIERIQEKISQDDILVVQGQCCTSTESHTAIKNMQKILGISNEQLSSLESAAGLCLIKHPNQPVLIKTVSDCGEEAIFDFSYCMPLITDCNIEADKTYYEHFQPLSDLLNSFIGLYHAPLPMNSFDSALKKAIAQFTTIYHSDIPEFLKTVRCHFIVKCIEEEEEECTQLNELENIQTMQN